MRMIVAALISAALAACSPGGAETAADPAPVAQNRHPVSGLKVIALTVTSGDKVHKFQVEVADTPDAQSNGLMFRESMAPDEGMIFPRDGTSQASFWMKNTYIPLDLIFIGVDGRITNIAANAAPYELTPIPSDGLAAGVLELNGGRAAALGIGPGDKVAW